jgi:PhnB protein
MEPTIYPFFRGNCIEAMTGFAEALGGEIVGVFRHAGAPESKSRLSGDDDMMLLREDAR